MDKRIQPENPDNATNDRPASERSTGRKPGGFGAKLRTLRRRLGARVISDRNLKGGVVAVEW